VFSEIMCFSLHVISLRYEQNQGFFGKACVRYRKYREASSLGFLLVTFGVLPFSVLQTSPQLS